MIVRTYGTSFTANQLKEFANAHGWKFISRDNERFTVYQDMLTRVVEQTVGISPDNGEGIAFYFLYDDKFRETLNNPRNRQYFYLIRIIDPSVCLLYTSPSPRD